MKLSVRPGIVEEESLTSYLLRLSYLNKIEFKDLIIQIKANPKITTRNAHHIDINPIKSININKLNALVPLANNLIDDSTFNLLIKKFIVTSKLKDLNATSTLINKLFIFTKRRYCTECLKENIAYKILWQVNDISFCVKHRMKLTSTCIFCKKEQPFIHRNLALGQCFFAQKSLHLLLRNLLKIIRYLLKVG